MGAPTNSIDSLDYDFSKFSFESFAAWVGQQLKCDIVLRPRQFHRSTFGIWVPRDGRHYLYYDIAPPIVWGLVNALHELGHVFLCHTPKDITEILATLRSDVVSDLQPRRGDPILGLCKTADSRDEQDKYADDWALAVILKLQRSKYPLAFKPHVGEIELLHGTGI